MKRTWILVLKEWPDGRRDIASFDTRRDAIDSLRLAKHNGAALFGPFSERSLAKRLGPVRQYFAGEPSEGS